jgi:hypothetical protein
VGRKLSAKEGERAAAQSQLQQKRSLLNESYLRKQNDIQVNMLEQNIGSRLNGKSTSQVARAAEDEALSIEMEKLDAQIQKVQQELEVAGREYTTLRRKAE